MNPRVACALASLAAAGLLGFGYFLQYMRGIEPCPLCLVQRAFFYLLIVTFLICALHGPQGWGRRLYGFVAMLFAAGGFATASRQVWLQHLPADQVPACGPDLFYMLDNFPLGRTVQLLLRGSGQCAEVHWRMLGLSIAEWSLVWFVILAAFTAFLALRKRKW